MNKSIKNDPNRNAFVENLPSDFSMPDDPLELRLLREYGAIFVAKGGATVPAKIVFEDSTHVETFQAGLQKTIQIIDGFIMQLQTCAMAALLKAIREAGRRSLSITPRASDSAERNYDETVDLWASRVEPALEYWVDNGKITRKDADRILALTPFRQVPEILKLEEQGIFFAKDLSKSIIYSVAPPGTSQHLSLLAFDIREHANSSVRAILENEGWFQTVISDLPHFTFLSVSESDLNELGLKGVTNGGRRFWVPDI